MKTHKLQVKENDDGELYFDLPDDLLSELGWEVGDEIKFTESPLGCGPSSQTNGYILTKIKNEK